MKAGTEENATSRSSQGSKSTARQEPFARVAPVLRAALLLGVCGGFTLATILTLSYALALPLGTWWAALAQAHGHLQLYGWAGLFVLGVALHFLPRLRGTPLAAPALVPWLLGAQVVSLCLRALSQPALVITGALPWRVLLIGSGILEAAALIGAIVLLGLTFLHGPALATRPAFKSTLLLMAGACCALALAGISNLVNTVQAAASSGLVNQAGDDLNVTIGLFGFLVSMALAMSVRSLPMYAGLEAFPGRIIRPLSTLYLLGVTLLCLGTLPLAWAAWLEGAGMCLAGGTLLLFICAFLLLMRTRGRLPQRVGQLAPHPQTLAQSYRRQVSHESRTYGPFVTLVGSAYLWAALGGALLMVNGTAAAWQPDYQHGCHTPLPGTWLYCPADLRHRPAHAARLFRRQDRLGETRACHPLARQHRGVFARCDTAAPSAFPRTQSSRTGAHNFRLRAIRACRPGARCMPAREPLARAASGRLKGRVKTDDKM